jgi:hypothetical protein
MNSSKKLGASLIALAILAAACSSNRILVPPRVDLASYGTVGLIEFSSGTEKELGQLATQAFVSSIQEAQPGVPVLELGQETEVLQALSRDRIDPAAVQAIGKKYQVDAVVFGQLTATDVSPRISLDTLGKSVNARAELEGKLVAKICDAKSGATLWTNAADGRETVAAVQLSRGGVAGGGDDLDQAQGRLVQSLVAQLTNDFWPHWE